MIQGFSVAGKSWVALVGSLAAVVIPWFVTSVVPTLPEPWPALIGAALALATAVGVYHAPSTSVPGRSGPTTPPTASTTGGTPWPVS